MRPRRTAVLGILLAAAFAGSPASAEDWPPFVDRLIAKHEAEPKRNPPGSIWRYEYKGRVVFYVPPSCCDMPSELYSSDGALICSPDGGMAGDGDGKCPDFFDARTKERLVWSDKR
jgi:hypothetical protein